MVPAPGRVSTRTVCPQASVSFCPTTRATLSTEPPGAKGTIILIGFSGYLSAGDCAKPLGADHSIAIAPRIAALAQRLFRPENRISMSLSRAAEQPTYCFEYPGRARAANAKAAKTIN